MKVVVAVILSVLGIATAMSSYPHQLSFDSRHAKLLVHTQISFSYTDKSLQDAVKRFATSANWTLVVIDMEEAATETQALVSSQTYSNRLERDLKLSWKEENSTLVGTARKSIIFPLEQQTKKLYRILDVRVVERTPTTMHILGRTLTQLPQSSLVLTSTTGATEIRFAHLESRLSVSPPTFWKAYYQKFQPTFTYIRQRRSIVLQMSLFSMVVIVALLGLVAMGARLRPRQIRRRSPRVVTFREQVEILGGDELMENTSFIRDECEKSSNGSSSSSSTSEEATILASDESDTSPSPEEQSQDDHEQSQELSHFLRFGDASTNHNLWCSAAVGSPETVYNAHNFKPAMLPKGACLSFSTEFATPYPPSTVDLLSASMNRFTLQSDQLDTNTSSLFEPVETGSSRPAEDPGGTEVLLDSNNTSESLSMILPKITELPIQDTLDDTVEVELNVSDVFSPLPTKNHTAATPDLSIEPFIQQTFLDLIDSAVDESQSKLCSVSSSDIVGLDLSSCASNADDASRKELNDMQVLGCLCTDKEGYQLVPDQKICSSPPTKDSTKEPNIKKAEPLGAQSCEMPTEECSQPNDDGNSTVILSKRRKKSTNLPRKHQQAELYAKDVSWDLNLTARALPCVDEKSHIKRRYLAHVDSSSSSIVKKEPVETPSKKAGEPTMGKRKMAGDNNRGKKRKTRVTMQRECKN